MFALFLSNVARNNSVFASQFSVFKLGALFVSEYCDGTLGRTRGMLGCGQPLSPIVASQSNRNCS